MPQFVKLTHQVVNLEHVTGAFWLDETDQPLVPQLRSSDKQIVIPGSQTPVYLQLQMSDNFSRTLRKREDIEKMVKVFNYYEIDIIPAG